MKKILYLSIAFAIMALPANAANLVENGDFELPEVTNSSKWQLFDSGTTGMGWTVGWVGTYPEAPVPASLELHEGVLMAAYDGDQSTELDTDWGGIPGNLASVKIYQDIPTCVGPTYTLSYAWSPRPGHSDNAIEVYWEGGLLDSHSGSTSGWILETHSGLNPTTDTTQLEFVETGNPDGLGMFLDAVSVEQIGDCIVREAEITVPEEGDTVSGEVNFEAYLIDDDEDSVQWAVRKGTCTAGTNTVFGNVDGYNDSYDWDYNSETGMHTFLATADTSTWPLGMYCFVFNPREDAGEINIRLTREFVVESCDEDGDGINDSEDMCPGTNVDLLTKELGTNRWMWDEGGWISGEIPGKGKAKGPKKNFTMEDTQGCGCFQILEWLNTNYPEEYGEMEGHYKHGCSIGIMQDFIELTSQE